MKQCKCCLKKKADDAFMYLGKEWRVTYCIDCARANMASWAAGRKGKTKHSQLLDDEK